MLNGVAKMHFELYGVCRTKVIRCKHTSFNEVTNQNINQNNCILIVSLSSDFFSIPIFEESF